MLISAITKTMATETREKGRIVKAFFAFFKITVEIMKNTATVRKGINNSESDIFADGNNKITIIGENVTEIRVARGLFNSLIPAL